MQQRIDKSKLLWGMILYFAGIAGFFVARADASNDSKDFLSLYGYKFLLIAGLFLIIWSARVFLKETIQKFRKTS